MQKLPIDIGHQLKSNSRKDKRISINDQLFVLREEKDTYIVVKPAEEASMLEVHGIVDSLIETLRYAYGDFNSEMLVRNCMSIGIVS